MANLILHKRNTTTGKAPLAAELTAGELALNTADGKVFLKKADNSVFEIASDKQPLDSELTAIAGLSTNGLIERTGAGTAGIVTITTAGKAILDDADAAAQRTTLGAQATITGAATTITGSDLTASMALVSDANGKVAASSTVSVAELGYLDGVTGAIQTQLNGKQATLGYTAENTANKNQANGYCGLDASGKVDAAQLPSYVDDVLESANLAGFPATGVTGLIYVALDTNKIYRWSGSAYIEISPVAGNADTATKLATARTISFATGDVTGSFNFDGSANVSNVALTLAANSVALGTDTTGNYVAAVAAPAAGLTVTAAGEGVTQTLALANDLAAVEGLSATGLVRRTGTDTWSAGTTVATAEITNAAVTYAKIQNVSATDKLLGRSTAGAGVIEEITCTAAGRALLDDTDAAAQRATLSVAKATLTTPADGQILVYQAASSGFINADLTVDGGAYAGA